MSYELRHDRISGIVIGVRRLADNACIPRDENNADWQAFILWYEAQSPPPFSLDDVPVQLRKSKELPILVQEIETWIGNGIPQLRRAVAYVLGIHLQSRPNLLAKEPGAPVGDEPA